MSEPLLEILKGTVPAAAFVLGYLLWIRPRQSQAGLQGIGLLFLVDLTLVGGLVGGTVWWMNDPNAFAWRLPPLAGRLLGAAGWAYAAAAVLTLRHPTRPRLRLMLLLRSEERRVGNEGRSPAAPTGGTPRASARNMTHN